MQYPDTKIRQLWVHASKRRITDKNRSGTFEKVVEHGPTWTCSPWWRQHGKCHLRPREPEHCILSHQIRLCSCLHEQHALNLLSHLCRHAHRKATHLSAVEKLVAHLGLLSCVAEGSTLASRFCGCRNNFWAHSCYSGRIRSASLAGDLHARRPVLCTRRHGGTLTFLQQTASKSQLCDRRTCQLMGVACVQYAWRETDRRSKRQTRLPRVYDNIVQLLVFISRPTHVGHRRPKRTHSRLLFVQVSDNVFLVFFWQRFG